MSRAPSDTCAGNLSDSNSANEVKTDRAAGIWFEYMDESVLEQWEPNLGIKQTRFGVN